MTRLPRPIALAALVLPVILTGCGGAAPEEEPAPYLVTDLEGGTAAPGTIPTPDPTSTATKKPKKSPATGGPDGGTPTGAELVDRIGGPAGALDSVRITIGDGSEPPDLEANVTYGAVNDFDATLRVSAEQPDVLLRRVDDTFYAGTSAGLEAVDPADSRIDTVAGGIVPAFLVWNPLLDLRAALEGAEDVAEGGPEELEGIAVTSYTFTVDLDDLPRPSLIVPDDVSGTAQVTLSLDELDLPVRLQFASDAAGFDATVVVGYSAWGAPVTIEGPESAG